jgi:hypothetical protein
MDPSLPQNKDSEVDKTVMKIEGYNGVRIARGVDYLFKEDMVGPIYPKLD